MGHLYELTFSNGKKYIGITVGTAERRFRGHAKAAAGNSTCAVHNAWRKYGPPTLRVLAVVENFDLAATEARAIEVFGTMSPNGYNQVLGAHSSPMHNPEIAAKVSRALLGHKINVGRKHTETSKLNMSLAQRRLRKSISQEHREALSKWMRERHANGELTEAYKKISEANKGKRHSEETKLKMSAWQKGVPKSPESIRKRKETLERKKLAKEAAARRALDKGDEVLNGGKT